MPVADHTSPREQVRADLRARLRELIDPAVVKVNTIDLDGHPDWANVPVVTVADLSQAIITTFDERLPAPSNKTAEIITPGTVFVAALCPECHVPQQIPMTVDVKLEIEGSVRTLHLKGKSKASTHRCGQLPLPAAGPEGVAGQESFGLDDIVGPVPTSEELMAKLEKIVDQLPEDARPSLGAIDDWSDLDKRVVMEWALSMADPNETEKPPLPQVLGGPAPDPVEEQDVPEQDVIEEEAAEPEPCPFPGCTKPGDHRGRHSKGAGVDDPNKADEPGWADDPDGDDLLPA